MKRNVLIAAAMFSALLVKAESDPVLMKINGKEIHKSEFEYIYNKNNNQQMAEHKDLNEYVDLFVNFKLKVAEAESMGLDTMSSFKKELSGYRQQLAKPYLVDQSVDERLAQEAYERMKENVECSHILFRVDQNATEADWQKAKEKADQCRAKILAGSDFSQMAEQLSEDPSAKQNKGYLGFISPFMMVYPFELAVYNTKVGEVSEPFRTQFGYHIVKVTNRRADDGMVLTSHIMKMIPMNAPADKQQEAKNWIDEVYKELQQGGNFEEIAKSKSEDKQSAAKGGELIWLSRGRIVKEYEDAAYALKNEGDYTQPVRTPYGWHIIKLKARKALEPYAEKRGFIIKSMARDERQNMGHQALVEKLKKDYKYITYSDGEIVLKNLTGTYAPVDSAFIAEAKKADAKLFSLAGKTYTTKGFAQYVEQHKATRQMATPAILKEKIAEYVDAAVVEYEDSQLENKYSDFKNLMHEYRDGILLFDVSNKLVWDKASSDMEGLSNYFRQNKKKYKWEKPRYRGYVVRCADEEVEKSSKKLIKSLPQDSVIVKVRKQFNNDSIQNVNIQFGLFAQGDNKYVDMECFKGAEVEKDAKLPVVYFLGKKVKAPESYVDVRGLVTSDYQNYLEKEWIKSLRDKYKVEIYEDVLKTVKPL